MKTISIMIPCYNEEENVSPIADAITALFDNELSSYNYELIFIDNASTDHTRDILRMMCEKNKRIKAIFNVRNFGQNNSPYYGLLQTTGDCTVLMSCDFQDPVELIPEFVREWENGYTLVTAIKNGSKENKIVYLFRSMYYRMFRNMSNIQPIEHFTGFGLYDRDFVNILRKLEDPTPFLRGTVAEYAYNRKEVFFVQPKRKNGKTHNNFLSLYDIAMRSFTSYTKLGIRTMSIISFILGVLSIIAAIVYFILKLLFWYNYPTGAAPILLAVLILGCFQLFFIGLLGEYLFNMNERIINRPLVVEEERINFDSDEVICQENHSGKSSR